MSPKENAPPVWLKTVTEASAKTRVGWLVQDLIPEVGVSIVFGNAGAGACLFTCFESAQHVVQTS
jgi:hypothetical protein